MTQPPRCPWAGTDPRMIAYHDLEWGVPVHDDRALFEFLTLEGAQAGLSWQTILNKRDAYREAFAGFDPARVARFDQRRIESLLANPGIVRNRLKVESTVSNALAVLEVQREFGSLDRYLWSFVGGKPTTNLRRRAGSVPASTPAIGCAVQGTQAARLPLRGHYHLLRIHAGDGHGQRSSRVVLSPPAREPLTLTRKFSLPPPACGPLLRPAHFADRTAARPAADTVGRRAPVLHAYPARSPRHRRAR